MHVRMKLILSYALIIALCLTLTALVSAVLLRNYQNRFAKQRIEIIADTTAPLLHDNNDPTRFDAATQVRRTADQTQTRLVVLEATMRDLTTAQSRAARGGNEIKQFDATVKQDTAGLLPEGTTVAIPRGVYESWQRWLREQAASTTQAGTPVATPMKNAQLTLPGTTTGSIALRAGRPLDLALIPLRAEKGMPSGDFRVLVVAEPIGSTARPLAAFVGTLAPAAGIAFLVSIIVALILARSITRPLLGLTAATRALASGDYQRRVAIRGDDEVAELGHSFNAMATEIERVRRRERDFLANISHDLKTPLTSIQGFAGALIDGTCPPDAYPDAARIIYSESQRMGHLVGDILQLSRLEAGELTLGLAPVDLSDLAPGNGATVHRHGGESGCIDPPRQPIGSADHRPRRPWPARAGLGQSGRECPPLHRAGWADRPHQRQAGECGRPLARLAVRDTGSGIAASDLPRIFERFYQADKSRVAGRTGSGLGLAIVKELIERHGGTVHAESVVGAGTTIYPDAATRAGSAATTRSDRRTSRRARHTRRNDRTSNDAEETMTKILVVDDEEHIRQLVSMYLVKEGFAVETAADGRTALSRVNAVKPDLVVLDLMLPELDGWEVCRTLRRSPLTEGLPIIMLTARDDLIDRILGLELGADDYLTKPFNPRELVARVRAVLRRTTRGTAPSKALAAGDITRRSGTARGACRATKRCNCAPRSSISSPPLSSDRAPSSRVTSSSTASGAMNMRSIPARSMSTSAPCVIA